MTTTARVHTAAQGKFCMANDVLLLWYLLRFLVIVFRGFGSRLGNQKRIESARGKRALIGIKTISWVYGSVNCRWLGVCVCDSLYSVTLDRVPRDTLKEAQESSSVSPTPLLALTSHYKAGLKLKEGNGKREVGKRNAISSLSLSPSYSLTRLACYAGLQN